MEKEIVLRIGGATWGFVLPEGHVLEERGHDGDGRRLISLSIPGTAGETFVVIDLEEDDEEIRYELAATGFMHAVGGQPAGYPYDELMNREQERIRGELVALTGNPGAIDAWAQGEGHEEHFRHWRAELRRLRREATGASS